MADSKIEWTDATWNPVVGCARVSAGCEHCYAETMAARHVLMSQAQGRKSPYLPVVDVQRRRWNRKAVFLPERLGDPLRWRKPRRVFVNSMSDLFHEDVTDDQIKAVFAVMYATPQHTYQVLTKRPKRMREFFERLDMQVAEVGMGDQVIACIAAALAFNRGERYAAEMALLGVVAGVAAGAGRRHTWPLPNVHLGVSVEDQRAADERIPVLLECPAALRFLSVEPLLEDVDLHLFANTDPPFDGGPCRSERIGWVIVGGESGPGARACDVAWIRSIVGQCGEAGVPVFVKQIGAKPREWMQAPTLPDGDLINVCPLILDRKGGNPDEWPEDLRVRQLPGGAP